MVATSENYINFTIAIRTDFCKGNKTGMALNRTSLDVIPSKTRHCVKYYSYECK